MINYSVFDCFPELQSKKIFLRRFLPKDGRAMYLLRSDALVMHLMDSEWASSLEDGLSFVERNINDFKNKKGINWVITTEENGEAIGYLGLLKIDTGNHRATIGYALSPQYWGKGIMSEAIQLVEDFAFKTLKIHGIEANVNPKNKASKMLLEKNGFKQEAYFRESYFYQGTYLDSVIYCKIASDVVLKEVKKN